MPVPQQSRPASKLGPARKVVKEVQSGLYLLHVPCTVYRLKTQCPGVPAGPGLKRNTWYGAFARMCAVVRNITCWSELQVT